jgi:spore coat protein H
MTHAVATTRVPARPLRVGRRRPRRAAALLVAGAALAAGWSLTGGTGVAALAAPPDVAAVPASATVPSPMPRPSPQEEEVEAFFARGPIPRLSIEIAPADLDKLRRNSRGYVPATIRELAPASPNPKPADRPAAKPPTQPATTKPAGGGAAVGGAAGRRNPATGDLVLGQVAVHLKGFLGSNRPVDDKPGWTLSFDKYEDKQRYHGLEKAHLNNCVQDPSYLSEALGNSLFRDAGVPAARCTHARVWLNGRDLGLYMLKEGWDDVFLKRWFADSGGALFESVYTKDVDSGALPATANKAKATAGKARLAELAAAAREPAPAARASRLDKVLDVDRYLTFAALEAMTAHWDGYSFARNNYRIYHDPKADRLVFLPHGTDQLFGRADHSIGPGGSLVDQGLLGTPDGRARYVERLVALRKSVFDPDGLRARVDALAARLAPTMEQMGPGAVRQHKEQTASLRQRIADRVKFIDAQLAAIPRPLKFDAAGVAAVGAGSAAWEGRTDGGRAEFDRPAEGGQPRLRLRAGGGGSVGSFRTTVVLPQGRYVFEGRCRTRGVVAPAGQNAGAGLRISGGRRDARLTGDADWQTAEFAFEVAEPERAVVLVCELRADAGEAWFDPASLRLRRR